MGPLLGLERVSMTYRSPAGGNIDVLQAIELTVSTGRLVVVEGRSGSGKTTLLRIASGLVRPTEGLVTWSREPIQGLDARGLTERRARHIGIVFQGARLVDTLTASENVALPAIPRGVAPVGRRRALELLDLVGIPDRSDHFPSQLSGGEQQRVAIARAMFTSPPLLVVDEPTANLDRRSADRLIELLRELAEAGQGLLIATHDPDVIGAADEIVALEEMKPGHAAGRMGG